MRVIDILPEACVRSPLEAADKRGVIDELVDLLAEHGHAKDATALKDAVWTREQTRTTGIGHGLAIPHGKSGGLDDVVLAVGKPAAPMEFEAIDGQPVRLIVLLASPPDRTSDHIQALARVSKLMQAESFRDEVYEATEASAIYQLVKRQDQEV